MKDEDEDEDETETMIALYTNWVFSKYAFKVPLAEVTESLQCNQKTLLDETAFDSESVRAD